MSKNGGDDDERTSTAAEPRVETPLPPTMAFPAGTPAMREEDDFFAFQRTEYTWTHCQVHTAMPTNAINDYSLTFFIPGFEGPQFLFLDEAVLRVDASIVDKDGKPPPEDAMVAPINAWPTTMFREARLFLNEVEVSNCEDGAYPLRNFIEMTLNSDTAQLQSTMKRFGYAWDQDNTYQGASGTLKRQRSQFGKYFDAADPDNPEKTKKVFRFHNAPTTMYGRIGTNFNNCKRPILPGVQVKYDLILADPDFYMVDASDEPKANHWRLKIHEIMLMVPWRQMNYELYNSLGPRLARQPALYPLKRLEMKKLSLTAGQQNFTFEHLTQSTKKPDRMLLAFVAEKWWEGGVEHYPLQSRSYFDDPDDAASVSHLTRANLTVNSERVDPIISKNKNQMVIGAYHHLIKNVGTEQQFGRALPITLDQFEERQFYLMYDMTQPTRGFDPSVRYATKEGHARLELDFDRPLKRTVNLFVMSEYNALVTIDKNRLVLYNYLA